MEIITNYKTKLNRKYGNKKKFGGTKYVSYYAPTGVNDNYNFK